MVRLSCQGDPGTYSRDSLITDIACIPKEMVQHLIHSSALAIDRNQ